MMKDVQEMGLSEVETLTESKLGFKKMDRKKDINI